MTSENNTTSLSKKFLNWLEQYNLLGDWLASISLFCAIFAIALAAMSGDVITAVWAFNCALWIHMASRNNARAKRAEEDSTYAWETMREMITIKREGNSSD